MPRDDEPIRRFSRKPNPWLIPVVGAAVIATLITGVCVVWLVMALSARGDVSGGQGFGVPGLVPTAENEGLNWDVKTLADHLHSAGVIGEYEVNDPKKSGVGLGPPAAIAKTPGGRKVSIVKHGGSLSAEQYAKSHGAGSDGKHYADEPAYQWGAFTIVSGKLDEDNATPVAAKLRGAKKFLKGELVR